MKEAEQMWSKTAFVQQYLRSFIKMKREDITDDLVADPFYSESNISYLEQKMDEYKKGELKFEKHEIDCSDESVDQTVKEKNTDESISHNYAEILKKEALDVKDKVENGTAPVFDNIDSLFDKLEEN